MSCSRHTLRISCTSFVRSLYDTTPFDLRWYKYGNHNENHTKVINTLIVITGLPPSLFQLLSGIPSREFLRLTPRRVLRSLHPSTPGSNLRSYAPPQNWRWMGHHGRTSGPWSSPKLPASFVGSPQFHTRWGKSGRGVRLLNA